MSPPVRVLLADDHPIVRSGLRHELDQAGDLLVVAEVGLVRDILDSVSQEAPDVAVLGVEFPDGNGIEACRQIKTCYPQTAVLMFTAFDDDDYLAQAWEAGVAGYLVKGADADALIEAIRRVAGGRQSSVVLAAFDPHRLSRSVLVELEQTRVPLVILASDPAQEPWASLPGVVLPLDVDAETVRQALTSAVHGERQPAVSRGDEPGDRASEPARSVEGQAETVSVIALASGHGSPGRTTIAINLAAALGAVGPTVLVDAEG